MSRTLILAALAALAGCGGGGTGEPTAAHAPTPPARLMFIGNSLTVHTPEPSIGWAGTCGMAASDCAHDYAHLVASALSLPLTTENVAVLEEEPATHEASIPDYAAGVTADTAVVLEMGDDVVGLPDFARTYPELISALSPRQSLTCLSTWWGNADVDAVIKHACEAAGGRFVFIGDIYPSRADVLPPGENPGVQMHPHDPSMAAIAARLVAALGSQQ